MREKAESSDLMILSSSYIRSLLYLVRRIESFIWKCSNWW